MYIYFLITKHLKSEPTVPLLKVVPTLCHSITLCVSFTIHKLFFILLS